MEKQIIDNLENPGNLEKLYRADKQAFKNAFNGLYSHGEATELMRFWHHRLNYTTDSAYISKYDAVYILIAVLVAGLVGRIPFWFGLEPDLFYSRNVGFILFPALTAYFAWKNRLGVSKLAVITGLFVIFAVYINLLPADKTSDSGTLASIHLLLPLWFIFGYAFTASAGTTNQRLSFLRFNGSMLILSTIIAIAAGITTGITVALFDLLGIKLETFFAEYILVFGLPTIPILAMVITWNHPQLVGKVSPLIARIFSPVVLVMLVAYLGFMVILNKNPYTDREFLILFNLMLLGVMALIFFSIAESKNGSIGRLQLWILMGLSVASIVVNAVALSAIVYRITAWGLTPNRVVVLGANLVILTHLLLVSYRLWRVIIQKESLSQVENAIGKYLPVYLIWALLITLLLPFVFGYK
jgi:hypothetical protein